MSEERVYSWQEISADFKNTILLGNGSSIAIDKHFSYASLLNTAKELGLVTQPVQRVFDHLHTQDFELVLNLLWRTYHVNTALEIKEKVTREAYEQIRTALVKAVQTNHAEYAIVQPHVVKIYEFLSQFREVFSLNYDLVLYWAMMSGNEKLGRWFKDCFVDGTFERNWHKFLMPYGADGVTLVFYPHGNLILASSLTGEERKLTREDQFDDLLDRITRKWEEGKVIPLFVSEGTNHQKLTAIRRSNYLSAVHGYILPVSRQSLVIYGSSLNQNDYHILDQLWASNPARIAISVYRGDKTGSQLQEILTDMRKLVSHSCPAADLKFFDAESDGCWIH